MTKKNIIIISILSFIVASISGCGVMSNPKETIENDRTISNSIANSVVNEFSNTPIDIIQLVLSNINSEFISIIGDNYQIFDTNDSLQDFFKLINENKNLLENEDIQKINQLINKINISTINFKEKNLLFYPFRTENNYKIEINQEDERKIFSIKLDLNESYKIDTFYNMLFYQVKKSIQKISTEEMKQEIAVLVD